MEKSEHLSIKVRTEPVPDTIEDRYVDLLKRSLTRVLFAKTYERQTISPGRSWLRLIAGLLRAILALMGLELVRLV